MISKNKPLRIFGISWEDNGVGWYRVIQPLKGLTLEDATYPVRVVHTPFSGQMWIIEHKMPEQDFYNAMIDSDIVYSTVPKNQEQMSYLVAARKGVKNKVVVDIDDYLSMLNYDHPNKFAFEMENPHNPAFIAYSALKMADMVTTTTDYLRDAYKMHNKNIFVNPNTMDIDLWDKLKPARDHKRIRIGWAGASGHIADLKMVAKAVNKIKEIYGNKVEIILFGDKNKQFKLDRHQPFVSIVDYHATYKKLGFDIAIAPMLDSAYNRGKSNLRLLEAGVNRIPVVASPVGPYKDFPCLYASEYEEWVKQLRKLVDHKIFREKLGNNARKEVEDKYSLKGNSSRLYNKLLQLNRKPYKNIKLDDF